MVKFIINNINIISCWKYNLTTNTDCTICRCNLNTNSIFNKDNKDSILSEGHCGHIFHLECIEPWVIKNKRCPICSLEWKNLKHLN